jgi:hypothetical protein
VQGLFLSTASSVDVQRVSLPTPLSVYVQGVHYHQYSFLNARLSDILSIRYQNEKHNADKGTSPLLEKKAQFGNEML